MSYGEGGAGPLTSTTRDILESRKKPIPNPGRLLATGFLAAIAIGTLLLSLPIATTDGRGLPVIDALFMATSATCVTGLVVVDVGTVLSRFGHIVVLILFQFGGIGIMTVTTLFAFAFGRRISLSNRLTMGEALGNTRMSGNLLLLRNVIIVTLAIEGLGALFLAAAFRADFPLGEALFRGVFHSVSAFCNAGFDLFGTSLQGYTTNVPVNFTVMFLIVAGGLGFYVLSELMTAARRPRTRLTLHTRVVLGTTAALIIAGTLAVFIFDYVDPATLGPLAVGDKLMVSLFQAVTARTAGFSTVPISALMPSTLLIMMMLMFIGGAPGSTGGGIKVTVLATVLASVRASFRRREDVELAGRRLPPQTVSKAWVIAATFLSVIIIALVVLLATEDAPFVTVLFETISATATVGLSMGLTPDLSPFGRILLPCLMFFGRVGPLTLAVALAQRRAGSGDWHRPEENIYVG